MRFEIKVKERTQKYALLTNRIVLSVLNNVLSVQITKYFLIYIIQKTKNKTFRTNNTTIF